MNLLPIVIFLLLPLLVYAFISPKANIFGRVIPIVNTDNARDIFLTFDDGPNGIWTEGVLEVLDRFNVKATFFLIRKNVEKYPELVKMIYERGHSIGNHSCSHSYFLPFSTYKNIKKELFKTEDLILRLTGKKPEFFRPPHGLKTPRLIRAAKDLGYQTVTWSIMAKDYRKNQKAMKIVEDILANLDKGNIVVLHDGVAERENADRKEMLIALERILVTLRERCYQFKRM